MPQRVYKIREVNAAVRNKVRPEMSAGKEMQGHYRLDGKRLFRVTFSKEHGGADYPPGTLNNIRNQLQLSKKDFDQLVNCPMSGADYEAHIRAKIEQGHV